MTPASLSKSSAAHLLEILDDPTIDDEQIDRLFPSDWEEGVLPERFAETTKSVGATDIQAFWDAVAEGLVDPTLEDVTNLSTAHKGFFGVWNKHATRKRNEVYDERVHAGTAELRILSEGDSWTQHPLRRVKDVVHHIIDEETRWAIKCHGAGGDWIANMAQTGDVLKSAVEGGWDAVLLSGGGNDLVGKASLLYLLKRYQSGKPASWYLGERFELRARGIEASWRSLLDRLEQASPGVPVVAHGYAYAHPDRQQWLGDPMKALGITDEAFQAEIVQEFINRHNDMLLDLEAEYDGRFFHVECRDLLTDPGEWGDELHPKSEGFGQVAERVIARVRDVTD